MIFAAGVGISAHENLTGYQPTSFQKEDHPKTVAARMKWIILAAAAAAISNALPVDDHAEDLVGRATSSSELATFDDIKKPVENEQVPTPYKGLNFSNFYLQKDVQAYRNSKILIAPSSPYFAIADSDHDAYVSIDGTKTKSFDLDSFYFGCFDSRSQAVRFCNFTVTGLNAQDGRHQGPVLLLYAKPIVNFSAPMEKFQIGWSGLKAFYIDLVTDVATLARTVKVIDSVEYTTYK